MVFGWGNGSSEGTGSSTTGVPVSEGAGVSEGVVGVRVATPEGRGVTAGPHDVSRSRRTMKRIARRKLLFFTDCTSICPDD